jgi:hypothetical protein
VTQPFAFVSESIAKQGTIVERQGIRGTRSHTADDTRQGPYRVLGQLVLEPTPQDLSIWLPRILGAAPSGTTYALAETLPDFVLSVDRGPKVFTYGGCKVNKAVFQGAEGSLLRLTLDIVGKTESVAAAGTFPALTLTNAPPFIFSDLTLTLQSAAREVKQFELAIDNRLATDRFMNSLSATALPESDRLISLHTVHAWADQNVDLYDQALAGAAGSLALVNGVFATTFNFAALQCAAHSPVVQGKQETPLILHMLAHKTGSTSELSVTHATS